MKKNVVFISLMILIILGGCQMHEENVLPKDMDPKDLPEGRAFEDEYTRKFIQSTEEVMPGYYPFLANNGKYEMAFPKEGKTAGPGYRTKDNFESLFFQVSEEGKDTTAQVDVKYYSYFEPGYVDSKFKSLQSNIGLPLEFEEVSEDGQTYYIAPYEDEENQDQPFESYGYAAYIQKEPDAGAIYVIYTLICRGNCEETKEADMQEAYDWILTIQFLNNGSEKDED